MSRSGSPVCREIGRENVEFFSARSDAQIFIYNETGHDNLGTMTMACGPYSPTPVVVTYESQLPNSHSDGEVKAIYFGKKNERAGFRFLVTGATLILTNSLGAR
ncbi:MAG: hypothetical protein U0V70_15100 [Terriglobia bacterium]